jgi:hypothetical protein
MGCVVVSKRKGRDERWDILAIKLDTLSARHDLEAARRFTVLYGGSNAQHYSHTLACKQQQAQRSKL